MTAINAAWEPHRRPATRDAGSTPTGRSSPTPTMRAGRASSASRAHRRPARQRVRARRPTDIAATPPPERSRATGRRAARRSAAATTASMQSPTGSARPDRRPASIGQRPQLRSLRRLVDGRDRSDRTSSTSSGSTGRRSAASTARRSTASCGGPVGAECGRRGQRSPRPVPPPLSSAAWAPASDVRATTPADRRPLDEQREQHDAERDLLEQRALGHVRGQRQRQRHGDRAAQPAPEQDVEPVGRQALGETRQRGQARGPAEQDVDDERPSDEDRRRPPTRSGPSDADHPAGGIARPISRKTTAVSRNARNSQTVSIASAPDTLMRPAGAEVAEDDARDDRRDDPRQVELVGDQVAAVGEHDRIVSSTQWSSIEADRAASPAHPVATPIATLRATVHDEAERRVQRAGRQDDRLRRRWRTGPGPCRR